MNPTKLIFAGLILLPTVGLVTWAWFAMARVEEELRSVRGFTGMHLED